MAKDPAVLFYYSDFLTGTAFMTDDELGKYIKILCHQADKGKLTKQQVLSICKASVIPNNIQEKLLTDENGLMYNKRMLEEKEKRVKFSESRRNNAKKEKTYAKHMENENINKDINDIKEELTVTTSEEPTIDEVKHYFDSCGFSIKDAENFYSYYSSQDWKTTSGVSIKKRWQNKVIGFMNNQKQFGDTNGKRSSPKGSIDLDKFEKEFATIGKSRT